MIRVRQVKINILEDNEEIRIKKICKKLNINKINKYYISKKSIDARDKNNIYYVYEFDIDIDNELKVLSKSNSKDIFISPIEEYILPKRCNNIDKRIVIIGSGPAGLFCSYILAELGYNPLVIEQGEKIEDRVKTVEEFFSNNKLNVLSNIQFGEGGAGTFSDGKLNTLVKDKSYRGKKVFEIFIENGAPKEIMYESHPHIGTDLLRKVIVNIRNKIIDMGGEFKFKTKMTDIIIKDNKVEKIIVNNDKEILCDYLVLAIGHSARNTFYMLNDRGLSMKNKNFAVGFRIEHPQDMINISQYGKYYKLLPPASYKLIYQSSTGRGVYSFCMCPGGYVVNASSEENRLVVNGMSNYKRDSINSNSAIVVTVSKKDYGDDLFAGLEFQRRIEEKAYKLGAGYIPIQLLKDYYNNTLSKEFINIRPCVKGNINFSNLNDIYSKDINDSIKEGITYFGKRIKGFNRDDAILLGVETRTSSPIRIERDDKLVSNIKGIYPCGEGAGYAGGITTSAIDGIKVAEEIIKNIN